MTGARLWLSLIAVALIAGGAGAGLRAWLHSSGNDPLAEIVPPKPNPVRQAMPDLRGSTAPAFALPTLQGETRRLSDWEGRVRLINFWATWCPPCRRELPTFQALQDEYATQGFQVITIAIDDPDSVAQLANELGLRFPLLAHETHGLTVARDYGNTRDVMPYSVVVDRDGRIVEQHAGELTRRRAEQILLPLLSLPKS
jgi:peroxiredoxin